jgi:hypothetical protein
MGGLALILPSALANDTSGGGSTCVPGTAGCTAPAAVSTDCTTYPNAPECQASKPAPVAQPSSAPSPTPAQNTTQAPKSTSQPTTAGSQTAGFTG